MMSGGGTRGACDFFLFYQDLGARPMSSNARDTCLVKRFIEEKFKLVYVSAVSLSMHNRKFKKYSWRQLAKRIEMVRKGLRVQKGFSKKHIAL